MWLRRHGERISTLDLFDRSFVLLAGPNGQAWTAAAKQAIERLGMALDCYSIGPSGDLIDESGAWPDLYGVDADGAVLVRPDGHVAWRAKSARGKRSEDLLAVLRRILSLD